ncbi:MAG TPA: MHYT domain-containing protein [Candidatus Dormibacteraeota bacterium]|nr:MHYT domain-containing protein [Candidatus Dormibacteraeota bacterium]
MVPEGSQLTGQYSFLGVALSIVIAALGSYVALDLADQVAASRGHVRRAWWTGTLAMGIAIWSMHYTGMLAFHLPIPVRYHVPTTLLSFCIAVLGSAVGLHLVIREQFRWSKTTIAALFNGAGIVGLHFTSMASMRAGAVHRYDPGFVLLSVVIAVAGSLLSFWLTFGLRETTWSLTWKKVASALAMGMAAISGMHYAAMAGTKFFAAAPHHSFLHTVDISPLGIAGVVVVTVMVLAFMLFSAVMVQRVERAAESLILLDAIPQQIWSGPPDGTLDYCNERWRAYSGLGLEEIQGDGWRRMLHPDDQERVLTAWHTSVTEGTPYEQEERHRRADGTYRWFLARGIPFRDARGRIIRWYGTNTDIEDRKQAEEELRRLSGQLLRLQDEERRKIARDLHDSTAHQLVLLAASLQQLQTSIPTLSSKTERLFSEAEDFAAQALREVRTLSYLLYPPMLDESGLEDAISDYVEGYSKRSGVHVDVQVSPNLGRLGRDTEMALFRVVQESLTNVHLHSGSRRAWIRLDRMRDSVILEIKDEGDTGRNPETRRSVTPGVGILSMRERVTQMAGHLDIESSSAGTTIRATIPINDKR